MQRRALLDAAAAGERGPGDVEGVDGAGDQEALVRRVQGGDEGGEVWGDDVSRFVVKSGNVAVECEFAQDAVRLVKLLKGTKGINLPLQANGKQRRGFAAMDPKVVSEIAKKGGIAAHEQGKAHEFTVDEARSAGSKGGTVAAKKRWGRS
ncbi:MAG: hypothetical protein LUO93_00430 [Methanomicrobiales archaeon]|nr:hypothetical protein [Methanomicrobiales archaeon]